MDKKHIEYNEIDDENIYIPIAEKHNIASMPFGEINGKVVTNKELMKYITEEWQCTQKNIIINIENMLII